MNNPNGESVNDGRLTVILCLLFGLVLSDFIISYGISLLIKNNTETKHAQLHIAKSDMLIVENSLEAGRGDVPAKYTPFFFELIPINTADKELLMTVNGIGPAMADRIISYREKFGPFITSLDLENLHGVGPRRAAQLASVFTFNEEDTIP